MTLTLLRRLQTLTAVALLASAMGPASLSGQSPDVRVGDRVRLDAPRLAIIGIIGRVTRTTRDTLYVQMDATGRIWPIATGLVSELDVSLGRTPRSELLKQSVLAGAAAGAVIGATIGLSDDDDCRVIAGERDCEHDGGRAAGAAGIGMAAGIVLGGFVGLVRPAEQWVRIDPPIRFAAGHSRDGEWSVALGMRLTF